MYLFGGYVNTDWIPSGKEESSRTFCDLWQLCIDVPGVCFEDVDVVERGRLRRWARGNGALLAVLRVDGRSTEVQLNFVFYSHQHGF
jgi:hypothetical protein